jgi:hypothetical protein
VSAYLAVCAIYRDEASNLREWVAFHRLVGVERFFLYDNRSGDDHLTALAPFLEDGSVVLHDWPMWPGQLEAYEHCAREHAGDARWVAFIDVDEFLFSPTGRPVPEILAEYEQHVAVGANWANFGTSGHLTRPPGLVIENYLYRTNEEWINVHYKTIADPRRIERSGNPHWFAYKGGDLAVDERHRPITGPPFSFTESVSFEKLRVNHYATKSDAEYDRKLARGKADTEVPKTMPYATKKRRDEFLGQQYDDTVVKLYLPALRESLAALEKDEARRPSRSERRSGSPTRSTTRRSS